MLPDAVRLEVPPAQARPEAGGEEGRRGEARPEEGDRPPEVIVAVVVLALVVLALMVERHADRRAWATERAHLVHLAVSRHPGDVTVLERSTQPRKPAEKDERPVRMIGG